MNYQLLSLFFYQDFPHILDQSLFWVTYYSWGFNKSWELLFFVFKDL